MSHPKGVLMERAQKLGLGKPEFRTEQTGPEHEPRFLSDVVLGGEVLGTGQGGTKRTAETHAAEEALTALEARDQDTGKGKKGAAKGAPAAKSGASGKGAKAGGKGAAAATDSSSTARSDVKETGAATKPTGDGEKRSKGRSSRGKAAGGRADQPDATADRANTVAEEAPTMTEPSDEGFDGPWPMFDDLLAAVVGVAERRVSADLRGAEAQAAIRDFSLDLYKDLLLGLGDVVEEDEEEDEDED